MGVTSYAVLRQSGVGCVGRIMYMDRCRRLRSRLFGSVPSALAWWWLNKRPTCHALVLKMFWLLLRWVA